MGEKLGTNVPIYCACQGTSQKSTQECSKELHYIFEKLIFYTVYNSSRQARCNYSSRYALFFKLCNKTNHTTSLISLNEQSEQTNQQSHSHTRTYSITSAASRFCCACRSGGRSSTRRRSCSPSCTCISIRSCTCTRTEDCGAGSAAFGGVAWKTVRYAGGESVVRCEGFV